MRKDEEVHRVRKERKKENSPRAFRACKIPAAMTSHLIMPPEDRERETQTEMQSVCVCVCACECVREREVL